MKKSKKVFTISITLLVVLILTNITAATGFTVHEDGTWTMLNPEDDCHTFGTVADSYFTNSACKELTDRILVCLEGCYSGIEYKPEYIDLYGPYYCEEICYPICEVLPDDPLKLECEGKTPLSEEEDQTNPLTTQTVQDELIQEQCRETCRNEYGTMTTGKTREYNPKPQYDFLGYIDECQCTCDKGSIYENEVITKPYCGVVYDEKTNYCGPAGKFSVPRKPTGIDFNRACYNHDLCYETATPQKTCDGNMLMDMRKSCNQATEVKRFVCLGVARIYYHGVSTLGSWIGTKS